MQKTKRVKTWKELEDLSIKLNYSNNPGYTELLVPSNIHGLKTKGILLNKEDELFEEDNRFEYEKKNNIGIIISCYEL